MEQNEGSQDPYSLKYFLIAVVVLLGLPMAHVIAGWLIYYL